MRRGKNGTVRIALEWKPQRGRPRQRPRKTWINAIEAYLKNLEVKEWRDVLQDRYR